MYPQTNRVKKKITKLCKATYILHLLCLSVCLSCANKVDDPVAHFSGKEVVEIKPTQIIQLEEYEILKPVDAIQVGSHCFIYDDQAKNMFNLVDPLSRNVRKGGERGSGPHDVGMPGSFQYKNDKIVFFDISQKRINEILFLSDTSTQLRIQEVEKIKSPNRLFMVNCVDTNYMATGIFNDYWLALINKQGEVISTVDIPIFEETKDIPKTQLSILYISTLMAHSPDNKKMIAATQNHGVLSFCHIRENDVKEYKLLCYYAPLFQIRERGIVALSKDNKAGFCAVDCDDQYVYVLYSGKTFNQSGLLNHHCDNLLVYDWDGNPVKRYLLDIPLFSMRYNSKNHSIYGIAYNPEGIWVEYKL